MEVADRIEAISREMLSALDEVRQIAPITSRPGGLSMAEAYGANSRICELRKARGERPIGRKLGFTNSNIWDEYGVYAPIWSFVYDSTVRTLEGGSGEFVLGRVLEPRIEPEITLGLKRAPEPEMDERALLECVDFVAYGFEIVQSLFPGWKFRAADTVAAFGLHGALFLGPRHAVSPANRAAWYDILTRFEVELWRNGSNVDSGHARNVLGGPLCALRHAVGVILGEEADRWRAPIEAGEIVTTGTLTRAFPVHAGDVWQSNGIDVPWNRIEVCVVS